MIFRILALLLSVGDECQIQMSFNSCEENGRKVSKVEVCACVCVCVWGGGGRGLGGVVHSNFMIEDGAISQTTNLSGVY